MNKYKWIFLVPSILLCFVNKGMEHTVASVQIQTREVRPFDSVPRELVCVIVAMAIEDDNVQKSIKTLAALVKTDKRFNGVIVNSKQLTEKARKIIQQAVYDARPGYYYFRHCEA